MIAPLRKQLQELPLYRRKSIVAVITQHKALDKKLKKKIKNRTLYTCRLFLLTQICQYISNWSKII